MKTIICTIFILFALSAEMLVAGGLKHTTLSPVSDNTDMVIDLVKLAPVPPVLADFTDGNEHEAAPDLLVSNLAPVAPKEADFEEVSLTVQIDIGLLSPFVPIEPNFEDADYTSPVTPGSLAPEVPHEADFTD